MQVSENGEMLREFYRRIPINKNGTSIKTAIRCFMLYKPKFWQLRNNTSKNQLVEMGMLSWMSENTLKID